MVPKEKIKGPCPFLFRTCDKFYPTRDQSKVTTSGFNAVSLGHTLSLPTGRLGLGRHTPFRSHPLRLLLLPASSKSCLAFSCLVLSFSPTECGHAVTPSHTHTHTHTHSHTLSHTHTHTHTNTLTHTDHTHTHTDHT